MAEEIMTFIENSSILEHKKVIAEPGRFFAHQSTALLTKVIGVTKVVQGGESDEEKFFYRYFLSDGVYGSFNNLIYDHATLGAPEVVRSKPDSESTELECFPSLLFGPTCDGFDLILSREIPKLREGEHLLWQGMGAYTQCAASRFNGMPTARKWYYYLEAE